MPPPPERRTVAEHAARELLRTLATVPGPVGLRVTEAEGDVACLIQVWDARRVMLVAAAERRRRATGGRAECKRDILAAITKANRPLTRKEVLKALRSSGCDHGPGTVANALAT